MLIGIIKLLSDYNVQQYLYSLGGGENFLNKIQNQSIKTDKFYQIQNKNFCPLKIIIEAGKLRHKLEKNVCKIFNMLLT